MLKSLFGRHVRYLRNQEGLTQTELTNVSYLFVDYVRKIERELTSHSFAALSRTGNALSTDLFRSVE